MKAVLVDPYLKTIENVEVGDWRDIQKHLQCSVFGSGGFINCASSKSKSYVI